MHVVGRDIPMDMDDEPCPHLCNIIGHQIGVQEKIRVKAVLFVIVCFFISSAL